jgi:hypothetical protein
MHCVFTLDYEIFGNGRGDLRDLVYAPAQRLREIFLRRGARFVNFVEVAELERIEEVGSDPAITLVNEQVRALHEEGFETGLHVHPQWYNATYRGGQWELDYGEYSLCTLPRARVTAIIERALGHLRRVLGDPHFTPLSYRAGNWLFQPTQPVADVLAQHGFRVDSSVFKGGIQRRLGLDYRRALRNGDYWTFDREVSEPDPHGTLTEIPIHVEMVPFWRMLRKKRLSLHGRSDGAGHGRSRRIDRLRDFMRFRYPLKLDFCRMTLDELTSAVDRLRRGRRAGPDDPCPIVAIGHTKDLVDPATVDAFLAYLEANSIAVTTFNDLYPRLSRRPAVAAQRADALATGTVGSHS